MKYLLSLSFLFIFKFSFSQIQFQGQLKDAKTGEAMVFGTVAIYKNGVLVSGTEADIDGHFSYSQKLEPGFYSLVFSYVGYKDKTIEIIALPTKEDKLLEIEMEVAVPQKRHPWSYHGPPLIEQDNTTQGFIFYKNDIRNMPHRGN